MKRSRKILIAILVVLVVLQFFRPAKNISAGNSPKHISAVLPVPDNVQAILKKACYDCHSNNTHYPWYAEVQPLGWWIGHHVDEGKGEINFDEFAGYRLRRQYHKLEEVMEQVQEGEMPLSSYTLIHGDAKLSDADKKVLSDWTQSMLDTMKQRYPADSLKMPPRKP